MTYLFKIFPLYTLILIITLTFPAFSFASSLEDALKKKTDIARTEEILLEADAVRYDYSRDIVTAEGNVHIYVDEKTIEADILSFDRRTNVLSASGHVRAIDAQGRVVRADYLEMSKDFRDAFMRALKIDDTQERVRFTAEQAIKDGPITQFQKGLYTVYTDPRYTLKAPPWQIRALEITHDADLQRITYEKPTFEVFGHKLLSLPHFSHAYPAEGAETGFLRPTFVYSQRIGYGLNIPFLWAISPSRQLTFVTTPLSQQGLLGQISWEHALDAGFGRGAYAINLAGIHQANPERFSGSSGDRTTRLLLNTTGDFDLTSSWSWGWSVTAITDRAFVLDYTLPGSETSQLWLKGENQRTLFDVRGYMFRIFQEDYISIGPPNPTPPFSSVTNDRQEKQAYVHPVVDYSTFAPETLWGGEVGFDVNITSLSREETDAFSVNDTNYFKGVSGTFSRFSLNAHWRRQFISPGGHVFTPFLYGQADLFYLENPDKNVTQIADQDRFVVRGLPGVGVEYSFPLWGNFFSLGTHVIEPTAQLILRTNETEIGHLPNEDSQSLVFDDTVLFEWDKFSGFDRVEGGARTNLGLKYTLQLNDGSTLRALFGQSLHLLGRNSFTHPDILDSTADTGLDSDASDFIGSLYYQSIYGFRFSGHAAIDSDTLALTQNQIQASALLGPITAAVTYTFLESQPGQGIDTHRRELQAGGSIQFLDNWRGFGTLRYDMVNNNLVGDAFGIAYDDEGLSAAIAYSEDRSRNDGQASNQTVYFRLGLRTLGDFDISNKVETYLK